VSTTHRGPRHAELEEATAHLESLTREWGGEDVDPTVIDGLIAVKRRDAESRAASLDSFNFGEQDDRVTTEVVEGIEASISELNEEKYRLNQLGQRIVESLREDQINFRPADAESLFRDAGVIFGDQVRRDYDQLIEFNRAITEERREALQEQLAETNARAEQIDTELGGLNERRAASLAYLRESESLAKYKELSRELTGLQADLITLDARRGAAARLVELRRDQRTLQEEHGHLQTVVERQIEEVSRSEESRFALLRRYFTEIVFEVLGQNAILAIRMNASGGLDFTAEFVGESGIATSGSQGTSYKKLLCIAFDLAMIRSYIDVPFARFVYHDGALEQLEPRKRENLVAVLKQYASLGLQPIVSVLDSDLPVPLGTDGPGAFSGDDVVLTLHDEGDDGRLFKMEPW
jgi:uncharacterized protein YydD (DUF2326 family)